MTQPDLKLKHSSKKLSWQNTLHLHTDHFTYLLLFHMGDCFFNGNTVLVTSCPLTCTCPLQIMYHYLTLKDSKFSLFPKLWLMLNDHVPTYSCVTSRNTLVTYTDKNSKPMLTRSNLRHSNSDLWLFNPRSLAFKLRTTWQTLSSSKSSCTP